MQTDLKLYAKSMRKVFRVKHIALNDDDANEYCRKHKDCGVIADDNDKGLVFIAEIYGSICPAALLED